MSSALTIAELEADIRWQADVERAELRHTSATLRRQIAKSIESYREMVSDEGWPYFLTIRSGSLTAGRATDPIDPTVSYSWGELDLTSLDPPMVRIVGLDVHYGSSQRELRSVSFSERNNYSNVTGSVPTQFFIYDQTKVGLMPPPSSALKYTISYLPKLPLLLEDDDEFNPGIPGGEQWVMWDVMVKIVYRDDYPQLVQAAMMERRRLETEVRQKARRLVRSHPKRRRDTRGTERRNWLSWLSRV